MKTNITTIFIALIAFFALGSCSDENNISDLQLNGLCSVDSIVLDNYKGVVDQASRTITVRVPETYDVTNMTVGTLKVSAGAWGSNRVGDQTSPEYAAQRYDSGERLS